ncbi:MAG: hypothetical protein DRK00_09625 [Thermoprotei archaeon]|nr:MAG: hypothetical protein DRK00_09625 [Thermoprotei archaeon]
MSNELERLKKEFIVTEEEEVERLRKALEKILPLAKVTKTGTVLFERSDLAGADRVALVIAARYLAGRLDDSIRQEVSLAEISEMTGLKKKAVSARISELADKGLVDRVNRGLYKARGLFSVEKIIEEMSNKYMKTEE